MNLYHKSAPKLMALGFILLVAGVFLAIQTDMQMQATALAILGFAVYVSGRVGMLLTPKPHTVKKSEADGENEFEV